MRLSTLGGLAIPNLWLALLVVLCLLILFRWSPPVVYAAPWSDPWTHAQKMAWPALILAWEQSAHLVRVDPIRRAGGPWPRLRHHRTRQGAA